jgi:eukaryotic-like serine/threonine-protein kinase
MALAAGTKLGPYEILAPLGAGGMGEVYRARDTRLERTVAIKILPAHFSSDPVRKQRFEREAKTISGLNHPHICVLYDVGSQDGVDYLVMEFVEGETLANRLEKGPLPLDLALKFGAQIADALDKAHRSGVVHRDLKPGNIIVTPTGAKLLDFGLAKPAAPLVSGMTLTTAPNQPAPVTEQGTIVGTFQYMSPEQVEGKELDARSDIFSLGAVLYEMVTGRRAFPGKSQLSVASAVLEKEPEAICTLQPLTPAALDRAIRICLAKEPNDRWQTARDLLRELRWIAEGGSQSMPTKAAEKPGGLGHQALLLSLGTLLLGAAITCLVTWNLKPTPPALVTRTSITLPPGQRLAGLDLPALALSPDGTQLAYVAAQDATQQIYLRPLDSLAAKPVAGTEGAMNPFFSPDGQWLGFFAGGKLKKISVTGGSAQILSDAVLPRGASWGGRGYIAFAPSGSVLQQIPEAGGVPQPLTRLEKGEFSQRWPEFLPDGKAVFFMLGASVANWGKAQIAVQSVDSGERRNLVQGGAQPRYAQSGHLIYAQAATLMAAPFDPKRLTLTGTSVPVLEGVSQSSSNGAAQYSISAAGTLAYIPGNVQAAQRRLVWITRDGREQLLPASPHAFRGVRLSPDGRHAAVAIDEEETQIWDYDLSRDTLTRLSFGGNIGSNPIWSSDGQRIAFSSNKDGPVNIYWQLADGSGGPERLTTSENINTAMSWSPDGRFLAFIEINPTTGYDIWMLRLSDRKAEPFLRTPFNESVPRFSPDGHWLVYTSDESGRSEIYMQPYPGPGGKRQISSEGGTEPAWNSTGRELFYRNGDKMMAVDIATQPRFTAGKPHLLFEGHYEPTPGSNPNYDVTPDGQRFLMLKPSDTSEATPTQINLILNWFEELKHRVPTAKN